MLVNLVKSLTNISPFLTRYRLYLNPASHVCNVMWFYIAHRRRTSNALTYSSTSLYPFIRWSQNSQLLSPPPSYTPRLTIATHNLPNTELNRLQHIQNSLARAVIRAPKSFHINRLSNLYTGLKLSSAPHRLAYKIHTVSTFISI